MKVLRHFRLLNPHLNDNRITFALIKHSESTIFTISNSSSKDLTAAESISQFEMAEKASGAAVKEALSTKTVLELLEEDDEFEVSYCEASVHRQRFCRF